MKYFVIPETLDGCEIPTIPEPVELKDIPSHLKWWLSRFSHQGYFSNCKLQRIPLHELGFRLQPEFNVVEREEPPREPRSTRATV